MGNCEICMVRSKQNGQINIAVIGEPLSGKQTFINNFDGVSTEQSFDEDETHGMCLQQKT